MTIYEFATRVADEALYELGESGFGPTFEITVEHIAQIMRQGAWRTKTQPEFSRWCKSVADAAMHMVQDDELPRGARLEMLSEMYYTG